MRWTGLLALVLLATLAGCHRGRAAGGVPVLSDRRADRLMMLASGDLACPTAALTTETIGSRVHRVSGCNGWRDYALFGVDRRARAARWQRVIPLPDRASADLACPASAIALTPSSATRYGASGCGRAEVLELQCTEIDCGWVGVAVAAPPPFVAPSAPAPVIVVPATATIEVTTSDSGAALAAPRP
jgi:hypothetical protein